MAVSMNVDYTRQLYTGLSADDWGSVEFNPGDVAYIMDRSECWIFDGSTMQQLPDLGGGGGEAHPYIQTFDYVQATAWTADSLGNTQNFIDTYCNQGNGIYWCGIKQTSSDTYKAIRGFVLRPSSGTVQTYGAQMLRGTSLWALYSTGSSFHILAGSPIRIWYIPLSTALEDMTS